MRFKKDQFVDVDVQVCQMPAPDQQFIDSKKWRWVITVSFNQFAPDIQSNNFDALNRLLLLCETNRVFIGSDFVSVNTDQPTRYDARKLAIAVCETFGYKLGNCRELKPMGNVPI